MLNLIQNRTRKSTAPNPYLRVLISAVRPQKSVEDGFCACFSWPNTVRAKSYYAERSAMVELTSCGLCHRAKGPSGEGLVCEANRSAKRLPLPGAARIGHFNEIRKAQPFVPVSSAARIGHFNDISKAQPLFPQPPPSPLFSLCKFCFNGWKSVL
jgi:hypothetical protein